MNALLDAEFGLSVPVEVWEFAVGAGIDACLGPAVELARRAFPTAAVRVSLGQDAEDDTYRYVALDVASGRLNAEQLLAGQAVWSVGIGEACPPGRAGCFVLGWS